MIIPVDIKPPKKVEKVWGYELWIHNDEDYCGKLLVFPKKMSHFSMHYHLKKKELGMYNQVHFNLIGLMLKMANTIVESLRKVILF
tara:strand:- start:348 stop:605 length:258 start_codon:yes stop_codon:yes gene_type:complete